MQNSTSNHSRVHDYKNDPRYRMFTNLLMQCYTKNISHSTFLNDNYNEEGKWCPRIFDGWSCWDETPASVTAYQACPRFIVGFDPRRFAYKRCTENGTWYINPNNNKPWTNYTTCVDIEDLDFRTIINTIYVIGYSMSVAALLLSLMIFLYFRSLQCTRIRIHMHLFTSFALNNILWIVWYRTVVNKATVVQENKEWCQLLHVITNYFMVTSYFWMFCEGLHLHIALVVVFVKDEVAMRWFIILGWGVSLVITIVYATVRYFTPKATERCWMDHSDSFWIIVVPVGISLLASFGLASYTPVMLNVYQCRLVLVVEERIYALAFSRHRLFLINVVRVLLTKLHPAPNQHASVAAKKAARAALILVPLFGLHFILIPLRPLPDSPGEKVYQIASALLTSLQGLCVAILFCFTNHDVMNAAKMHISRFRRANEAIAMTGNTYPLTGCYRG